MHQDSLLSGKLTGLFILLVGVYALLLAYKILPLKAGDPQSSDNWHKKYGGLMKIVGTVMILCGVGSLLLAFFK
jgi:multisubunit Na+/H+ antiporter MnhB subunit